MGQSFSYRRPAQTPTLTPASASTATPPPPDDKHSHRRSLPRRILSSIPKLSLRSRPLTSSLALPTRSEQTLRGNHRRWKLSRRRNVRANTEGAISEYMGPLTESDEHQVDRGVDEFGVITHRVPDNHSSSPAASTKGKEKARDVPDIEDDDENGSTPTPSTSTASPLAQSGLGRDSVSDDEVVIAPTDPPPPPPLPPAQESERTSVLPSAPTPPSPSPPPTQQGNTSPRPFPPPGTLVVVQGVVHTTDVPRSSDRPVTVTNSIPPTTNVASTNTNFVPSSTRPSSVPPETRPHNPLSGILPRPSSMVPAVPSPETTIGPSGLDSQARQTTPNASSLSEDSEDEDRTRTLPHGISMAQGPAGASGLSASSIDVLGTLLSVAAAATAASLLTGSSEPIFSSGLTASPPAPSSSSISQPVFNPNVPSERPLSPTPTSDAGRMRHVWSSLRDRLGLGSGTPTLNHSNDMPSRIGSGQVAPSQPSDIGRPRDPREIMLAEMARAFNLGLGLGGPTASPDTADLAMSDDADVLAGDRDGEPSSLPPPDSFERFLMDLQTDLRVTLMQEQEPPVLGEAPRGAEETVGDVDDQAIPELRSLSDSDSAEFGNRHFERDGEMNHEGDKEDVHIAREQPSGRTSPAVSALGTCPRYPSGVRTSPGSSSSGAIGMSSPHRARSQSVHTVIPTAGGGELGGNSSTNNCRSGDIGTVRSSSSIPTGTRTLPTDDPRSAMGVSHSQEMSNGRRREAQGCHVLSGSNAVPPLDIQEPSNGLASRSGQDSFLLGTSSSPDFPTSNSRDSLPEVSRLASQLPTQVSTSPPEPTIRAPSSINPTSGDSSMPFRLPFTPSSASRTEHTPGGGINWWRMYRFPAITSPNLGQGPQGSLPAFRNPAQDPSHSSTSPWVHTTDRNQQNEMIASRGLAQAPYAATPTNMPEIVPVSNQSTSPTSTNELVSNPPTNSSTNLPEHRSNVVVPVIVVGLQSVNMDRQPPHMPHPPATHPTPPVDDEDGEGMEFDSLDNPMSMPLHIPEPPEFRHHSSPLNTTYQGQNGQQPSRGRTWQSRAANAFRNLRPSRRNAGAVSPPPHEAPGSRTFLIYVIGGYYPPDHQIITGGNLDSFEALWELAELLGQVKPPTVSKEEIEKSGLEIIKASALEDYEKHGRIACNCVDRCLICLDDYSPEDDLRVLTCKHTFHQGCVDRWLETGRNNCPACRTMGVAGPTSATSDAIA